MHSLLMTNIFHGILDLGDAHPVAFCIIALVISGVGLVVAL